MAAAVAGGAPSISETLGMAGAIGGGVGAGFVVAANGGTVAGVAAALGSTAAITVVSASVAGVAATGIAAYALGGIAYDALPASGQNYIGGKIVAPFVEKAGAIGSSIWSGLSSLFGFDADGRDKEPPTPHRTR
jgi:predicted lipid-binding transport protein (Tim44 family)